MLDFNSADKQTNQGSVIPKNTVVPLQLNVRPGGAGPGGWLKRNNAGNALMLDCEFTVIGGEYERRKFWSHFVVEGESEGQKKAADITKQHIRAILESARGVEPSDESPDAIKARQLQNDYADLDGIRFVGVIGVQSQENYPDKNTLSVIVTPGRKDYTKLEQIISHGPKPAQSATAPVASKKPAWAS
jgi:hypothetical protein